MTLLDVMNLSDENKNMIVLDSDDEIISKYDGKNSIDAELNNYEVLKISAENNTIIVTTNK